MSSEEMLRAGGLLYREAGPAGAAEGDPVVLLHGFPESSLMWAPAMDALAARGRRCVAPDLYCLGDSDDPGPATFERNLEAFSAFMEELSIERAAIVVHDWGGFIGLAWACENPSRVSSLVISDTGFFHDGKWHGFAKAIREPGGEALLENIDRDGFAGVLRIDGAPFSDATVDAYWRPFESGRGRQATVEFYRSMDMDKLTPYAGKLGELGVPTLLLWGSEDKFAPVAGAKRFEREIPGAELVVIDGAGHFVFDHEPERCVDALVDFLAQSPE